MRALMLALLLGTAATTALAQDAKDWPSYGRDSGGTRFSPLKQITPANVAKLKLAWSYDMRPKDVAKPDNAALEAMAQTRWISQSGIRPMPMPGGGLSPVAAGAPRAATPRLVATPSSGSQFTPIVVKGVMYLATPFNRIAALEATTGQEKWVLVLPANEQAAPRGMHYWAGDAKNAARLVITTRSNKLITVDPASGKIITSFGQDGWLDLRTPDVMNGFANGNLAGNALPVMYQNLIIAGSRGQENPNDGPKGDVRAYDVLTGQLVWTFHAIPEPGDPNFGTWQGDSWKKRAGVNVWNMPTVDEQRGIVYLPFAAPANDRNGSDRIGDDLYGNALVAVDAKTGKYLWHFQTIHHDIWDSDLPAAPTFLDVKRDGKVIPAIAAINKKSLLFILDRVTGKPLYEVKETPVPASDLPGEQASPTQPIPAKPPPLARQAVDLPGDISDVTPEHEAFCKKWVADNKMVGTKTFQPLGFNVATVTFPGSGGGVNWGGGAFDKANGNYLINITNQGSLQFWAYNPAGQLVQTTSANSWFSDVRDGGMPCQKGPWGELVAVNVSTGDIAWRTTLGITEKLPADKQQTGRPNVGGPMVTAGGLIFIAATDDKRLRAFDAKTGKQVWETKLAAAGYATPMTFQGRDGKQYVSLIATGGSYLGAPSTSDNLVTYALP
ncbi:MAG: quinoprotein glucose dehydrogenase [Caulobacter sp.]|nr:quinoprotein glucose dehydrogenase [Caulobacter sp.]